MAIILPAAIDVDKEEDINSQRPCIDLDEEEDAERILFQLGGLPDFPLLLNTPAPSPPPVPRPPSAHQRPVTSSSNGTNGVFGDNPFDVDRVKPLTLTRQPEALSLIREALVLPKREPLCPTLVYTLLEQVAGFPLCIFKLSLVLDRCLQLGFVGWLSQYAVVHVFLFIMLASF